MKGKSFYITYFSHLQLLINGTRGGTNLSEFTHRIRDGLQISLLILSTFKRIN